MVSDTPRRWLWLGAITTCLALTGCPEFDQSWDEPEPVWVATQAFADPLTGSQCSDDTPLRGCVVTVSDDCAIAVDARCDDGFVTCLLPESPLDYPCLPAAQRPAETCNGEDDDEDGSVDEGFSLGDACSTSVGACQAHGRWVCSPDGEAICGVLTEPTKVYDGQCNGLDDDCDGKVDEHPPCNGGPSGVDLGGPGFGGLDPNAHYWSYIPAATYPRGEADAPPDHVASPGHRVRLEAFLIGRGEVTNAEWRAVMGSDPSWHAACDDCPVERVSWYEALEFTNRLSDAHELSRCYELHRCVKPDHVGLGCDDGEDSCVGLFRCGGITRHDDCTGFRLPTEAEWEAAARGGVDSAFWYGDDPSLIGRFENCGGRADRMTEPVTLRMPNPYGVRHMLGNVSEWVFDIAMLYDAAPGEELDAPVCEPEDQWLGDEDVPLRITRGGTPGAGLSACRPTAREGWEPQGRIWFTGFRLARTAHPASESAAE